MKRSFAVRGVVEGFYGTPWSHDARAEAIAFLGARGMNAYAYAPKDDPKHRTEWRTPYDRSELKQFEALAGLGAEQGVRFGFAVSPGLDIDYASDADRATLLAKLDPLRAAGVTWFLLCLDDIPMQPGLAVRQADLATWLLSALDGADLTLCPTEYVGTHPSPYLSDLGAGMPPNIDIMWTGPTVCSPELHADDGRGWTKALGDRRVVVWDNYPVNDALMTKSLHLGPYEGRDPELADVVGGILCNPMTQPHASLVALATAMDFMRDPDAYDAASAWQTALVDVGRERAEPLAVLARACADSPIALPETMPLALAVVALESELDRPDWAEPVARLQTELDAARDLTEAFTPSDPLGEELAPWALAARKHAEAGRAALRLIGLVKTVPGPDPEKAMHAAFLVLYLWQAARADEYVVFGPRFALYTPVVQMADGSPALDAAAAVREDANAIDALCRLALRTYDEWRVSA